MDYYKVSFTLACPSSRREIALAVLAQHAADAGFEAFEETAAGLDAYIPAPLFGERLLATLIATFPLAGVTLTPTCTRIPAADWNAAWEQEGFEPIDIAETLLVYDARRGTPPHTRPIMIGIEAEMAFGTGTHATTQMILAQLLTLPVAGSSVVDCGCGTGILALAASKSGAATIVAYDIDERCVANSRHNAALNGITNIDIRHGDATLLATLNRSFDIILANINRNVLLADMPYYKEVLAPSGTIIISGFFVDDIPLLEACAARHALTISARRTSDQWAMLCLKEAEA